MWRGQDFQYKGQHLIDDPQTDPRWIFCKHVNKLLETWKTYAEWQGGKVAKWQWAGKIMGEVGPRLY